MRCVFCHKLSFHFLCKDCKRNLSEFESGVRQIDGFKIYYFYKYQNIKKLIHSKHKIYGKFVYESLARLSFYKFAREFNFDEEISVIAIDDDANDGYSHTAVLAKAMKFGRIKPVFSALRATNRVNYAGKSLTFRKNNPRKFKLLKQIKNPVILVDDIVTTGSTMLEAKKLLEKNKINVLFGLVLADAKNN